MASLQATRAAQQQQQQQQQQRKQDAEQDTESRRTHMTPEEIGRYRATAQQNSIDSLRAAEDRYHKAKDSITDKFRGAAQKAKEAAEYLIVKAEEVRDSRAQKETVQDGPTHRVGESTIREEWGGKEAAIAVCSGCLKKEHVGLKVGETKDTPWLEEKEPQPNVQVEEKMRGMSLGEEGEEDEEGVPYTYMEGSGGGGRELGLLGSMGEMVMEIAQTATDLLFGGRR